MQGKPYFTFTPLIGLNIHRVVDYTIIFAILFIYIIMLLKMPRLYRERYTVVLISMIVAALWQSLYIFSRSPINRSMIGFGIFGIMVFYFAIIYRPFRLLDRMISNIASGMPEALFVFDPNHKCIWANEPGKIMVGITENTLDKAVTSLRNEFGEIDLEREEWSFNKTIGMGENERYYSIEKHTVKDNTERLAGSFLTVRDNTDEQRRIKRELYNSIHDSLTGLYTKQYFFECAGRMIKENSSVDYQAVFVDVKNFKIANDIFNTDFGDLALKQIADWIRADMNEKCIYGRLAGDTFGVFIPKENLDEARIENDLAEFIVSDGNVEHHIVIHLEVYEINDRRLDVSVMFDRAHLALTTINDDYKTHIAYYDDKLREQVLWDQRISAGLGEAIAQRQILPYLQPITDNSGRVIGAEALARWIHPTQGFMPPYRFIPIFEKNGMIVELDKHMWRCACELLSKWKDKNDLFISVNISPKDFYFIDVASEIQKLVKEYDIKPQKLRIEITETVMMNDADERMKILDELRGAGFIVEMYDFGSGYSSLNLLKEMPVDVLKIDMKFLSSNDSSNKSQTIIKNIIRLSEELGIASLTEGVETEQQYRQLSDMWCMMFQGYYFAKLMPADEFEKYASKA